MRTTSVPSTELSHASLVLFVRGFAVLLLASIAVRWPEETLLGAMVTASSVVAVLGVFELAFAVVSNATRGTRSMMILHALLSISFGAVTASALYDDVETTVSLAASWLLLHAVVTLAMLTITPAIGRVRAAIAFWAALNLTASFIVAVYSRADVLPLLYLGAVYAWLYGVVQIAVALWIRHHLRQLVRLGVAPAAEQVVARG